MATEQMGILTGIGVGPGDPDLITVKALRALQTADVVAFPAGRNGAPGVAEGIIDSLLCPPQIRLPLMFPYVLDQAQLQTAWNTAAEQVWPYLARGQQVVFASEGDISFYSTFTYLAQTLQQTHPEVKITAIPGVCSPLAAAAALGMPLTTQGDRLAILPALYSLEHLETALTWADVVVLMKVSSVYPAVWSWLQRRNLLRQSGVIIQASCPDQLIYQDLTSYPELKLPYFSLLVIRCRLNPLG